MAIAAVVLHATGRLPDLQKSARAFPWVVDTRPVPPDKLAVTLESQSRSIMDNLQLLAALPEVWNLGLVFVNYEDDLDPDGFMPCPDFFPGRQA